jgi:CheY-like chemotaxis protein
MSSLSYLEESHSLLPLRIPYIMVVESDPDIATLLKNFFKSETHLDILFAMTMKDALHVTRVLKPLLFLINEHLSDGDGLTLYDQLHQRAGFEHIPAVILSTLPHLCQRRARERQVICLELPFDLDDLLRTILSLLSPSPAPQHKRKGS